MAKKQKQSQKVAAPAPVLPPGVDFEVWWAKAQKRIPQQHRKEIVLADFKARGLSMRETTETYNAALEKYGVKLA